MASSKKPWPALCGECLEKIVPVGPEGGKQIERGFKVHEPLCRRRKTDGKTGDKR